MILRSILNLSYRGLLSSAMALALWGLILPPSVLAGLPQNQPESFNVTELEKGVTRDFERQSDGGYLWFGSDGKRGEVTAEAIADIEVLDVRESGGQLHLRVGLDDGFGGSSVYSFSGLIAEPGEPVRGMVTSPSGGTTAIAIGIGVGDPDLADPFTLVVVSVSLLGLACAAAAIFTNCAGECAAACAPNALESSDEGWCGSCECNCHIP